MKNYKKEVMSFAAACLVGSSLCAGDELTQNKQVTPMQNKQNMSNQSKPFMSVAGMPIGQNPCNGCGLSFKAEALLWLVSQGGLEYAINEPGIVVASSTSVQGAQQVISPKYNWGYRLGAGYDSSVSHWDFRAIYTYFYTNPVSSVSSPVGGSLLQTFTDSASNISATSVGTATARAQIQINSIDVQMSKPFLVINNFSLEPIAGVRNTWINETVSVIYAGGTVPVGVSQLKVDYINNFWGVGALAGLESQWMLGAGFTFFGNGAMSLLAGTYNLAGSNQYDNTLGQYSTTDNYQVTKEILDLGLGLRWSHMFDDSFNLGFQGGWEQHFVNNFWQFSTPSAIGPNGDLMTYGWNFSFWLDF